jgi:thiamine-phosphate pyrophosphorylase
VARRSFDLSLYLVTDDSLTAGRSLEQIVTQAISGGVTAVQIREKRASTREFLDQARWMRRITREAGVYLIVNDRIDVALAVDADGVHVGQTDMPADTARALLGDERVLGVTAADSAEAELAHRQGADYVGCSAVFSTPTKTDTGPPIGLRGLSELAGAVQLPVVAIGGIQAGNAAEVIRAGAAGIAVVSAIVAADDPRAAAAELASIIDQARR